MAPPGPVPLISARLTPNSRAILLASGEIKEIDTLSKQLGNQIDARVTIISKDGTVLGDSEEELSSLVDVILGDQA